MGTWEDRPTGKMYLSPDNCLAPDLMHNDATVVPNDVIILHSAKQGETVGQGQTILQFFTGTNDFFVVLLDFEDWGSEACPRFAYYKQMKQHDRWNNYKLVAVASKYDYSYCK